MIRLFLFLVFLPVLLRAHVGSPNVFFEGQAGPYPVRVILRPPAVLPGDAQVDVRAEGAERVTLQAALWNAASQAAPPVEAGAVAGETNLFNGTLHLFQGGSYQVKVRLEGARGTGEALVPLTSAAWRAPEMPRALGGLLIGLGALLFVGAVWWLVAVTRVAWPRAPSLVVTILFVALLAGVIAAGKMRWQKMDGEFRNNALAQPVPVLATVNAGENFHRLQLTPASVAPSSPNARAWDTLAADHGKLMHLFLLRAPDFDTFAHLHPVRRDARTFENVLPPLPAGDYRLYAEITRETGAGETLIANVTLPEPVGRAPQSRFMADTNDVFCQSPLPGATNSAQPLALDMDDSWHVGTAAAPGRRESRLMGGWKMIFQNAEDLVENRETTLRFAVVKADGRPAPLQNYMGMAGHCVVRRADGEVFTHLHPVGSFSMAAQEIFARNSGMPATNMMSAAKSSGTGEVTFPYAFPRPGAYRLWTQTRVDGRVLTGVFDVQVQPAR